tara:strand:+ start:5068 stop:5178 length:111 start_codon:yes stop_codon:yes gene_type:complete
VEPAKFFAELELKHEHSSWLMKRHVKANFILMQEAR